MPGIGGSASDDQFRLVLLRQPLHLIEVDEMVVLANSVLDRVEPLAGLGRRSTVREVAASSEAQSHDRVTRLQKREHHRTVRLRAGMRLDVRELAAEQLLCPFDRQRFNSVGWPAALVVAAARITFRIFVGENRALGFEHSLADDVLGRDQLNLSLLTAEFRANRVFDCRIVFRQAAGEKAVRHSVALALLKVGSGGHQSVSCNSWESWSTRRWWRPPAKPVSRKAATQALRHVAADEAGTESKHVGIIMLSGKLRRNRIVDARAAALGLPIDGNRNADPGAAHGDPSLRLSCSDSLGQPATVFGIVHALRAIGPKVGHLVPLSLQPADELVLEQISGVISGEGDAHDPS